MMTDEQIRYYIAKMKEQSIPLHWQFMVVLAMGDSPDRWKKMGTWLEENKDIPYDSMDLVNEVIKIKEEVPIYKAEGEH